MATFHEKHHKALNRLLEEFVSQCDDHSGQMLFPSIRDDLDTIANSAMSHKLRNYQVEALYLTAALLDKRVQINKRPGSAYAGLWSDLKDTVTVVRRGREQELEIPVLAYEMATGSGKTHLMGALILYLVSTGIKDFFIVTPRLAIYQKTIRNFQKATRETVWGKNLGVGINIITGENFTDPNMFEAENEINIYIFNLEKFGDQAKRTKVPIEGARHLHDGKKNLISLTEYLRTRELVILSDESHHTQAKFKEIIKDFGPRCILEFTATANHQKQNVIYQYNIRRLLEEKYCKTVMALGVEVGRKSKSEKILCEHEKIKLFAIMLVHLAKKYCLPLDDATKNLKPIALIRVNSTIEQGQELHAYLKEKLCQEKDIIDQTLKEIERHAHEITAAVHEVYEKHYKKDKKKLLSDVQFLINNSILYTSDSKDRKSNEETFATIQFPRNNCELILYITRLDEGIDMPNIYTIGVVFDSKSNLRTAVKQVIGRGVRLAKPQREFDDEIGTLRSQTEKVHIICDRGKNFEDEIKHIQKDFGVSSRVIGMEGKPSDIMNETLFDKQLEGRYFPRVRMSLRFKKDASVFAEMEKYEDLLASYIKHNTFKDEEHYPGKVLLRYAPKSIFTEVELFTNLKEISRQIKQNGGVSTRFTVSPKDRERVTRSIITGGVNQRLVPDVPRSFEILNRYMNLLEQRVEYLSVDDADAGMALIALRNTFSAFFRSHLEKHLCYPHDDEVNPDGPSLKQTLVAHKIQFDESPEAKKASKTGDQQQLTQAISQGYYFHHFAKSHFKYVKFDSFAEYQVAQLLEKLTADNKHHWWVRLERQLYLEYGYHRYFPDFLLCLGDKYYVIEAKGEIFSNTFKNMLLTRLSKANPDYLGLLLFEKDIESLVAKDDLRISDLIVASELNLARFWEEQEEKKAKSDAQNNVSAIDIVRRKFVDLVPVYSVAAACGKFARNEEAEIFGWVECTEKANLQDFFVIKAVGDSMEPRIHDGDYCLFRRPFEGSNMGKIILAEHNNIPLAEYGGHYTIKEYHREKQANTDAESETVHVSLRPLNPKHEAIEISADEVAYGEFNIVGVFVDRLGDSLKIYRE